MSTIQFTDLKDKNGKEIYKGDILRQGKRGTGQVYFDQGCFYYKPIHEGIHNFEMQVAIFLEEQMTGEKGRKVIGNIYENSELLI